MHFSIAAQKHAMTRHPSEYELCVPHLAQAVANPTYVGQAPDHKNKGFELVLHVQKDSLIVLIAIHFKPSKNGVYIVKSCYPINASTLDRRLRKKHLFRV